MTDCPRAEIRDVLPDWVHGTLGRHEAAEVGAHVAACRLCAHEASLLRALVDALDQGSEIDVARVAAGVTARTLGPASRSARRRSIGPIAGAVALAASVAFGALLLRGDGASDVTMSPVAVTGADTTRADSVVPDDSGGSPLQREGRTDRADGTSVMRLADAGIGVGGALAELGDAELEALLRRLDAIEAIPQTSPAPALTTDFEVR